MSKSKNCKNTILQLISGIIRDTKCKITIITRKKFEAPAIAFVKKDSIANKDKIKWQRNYTPRYRAITMTNVPTNYTYRKLLSFMGHHQAEYIRYFWNEVTGKTVILIVFEDIDKAIEFYNRSNRKLYCDTKDIRCNMYFVKKIVYESECYMTHLDDKINSLYNKELINNITSNKLDLNNDKNDHELDSPDLKHIDPLNTYNITDSVVFSYDDPEYDTPCRICFDENGNDKGNAARDEIKAKFCLRCIYENFLIEYERDKISHNAGKVCLSCLYEDVMSRYEINEIQKDIKEICKICNGDYKTSNTKNLINNVYDSINFFNNNISTGIDDNANTDYNNFKKKRLNAVSEKNNKNINCSKSIVYNKNVTIPNDATLTIEFINRTFLGSETSNNNKIIETDSQRKKRSKIIKNTSYTDNFEKNEFYEDTNKVINNDDISEEIFEEDKNAAYQDKPINFNKKDTCIEDDDSWYEEVDKKLNWREESLNDAEARFVLNHLNIYNEIQYKNEIDEKINSTKILSNNINNRKIDAEDISDEDDTTENTHDDSDYSDEIFAFINRKNKFVNKKMLNAKANVFYLNYEDFVTERNQIFVKEHGRIDFTSFKPRNAYNSTEILSQIFTPHLIRSKSVNSLEYLSNQDRYGEYTNVENILEERARMLGKLKDACYDEISISNAAGKEMQKNINEAENILKNLNLKEEVYLNDHINDNRNELKNTSTNAKLETYYNDAITSLNNDADDYDLVLDEETVKTPISQGNALRENIRCKFIEKDCFYETYKAITKDNVSIVNEKIDNLHPKIGNEKCKQSNYMIEERENTVQNGDTVISKKKETTDILEGELKDPVFEDKVSPEICAICNVSIIGDLESLVSIECNHVFHGKCLLALTDKKCNVCQ